MHSHIRIGRVTPSLPLILKIFIILLMSISMQFSFLNVLRMFKLFNRRVGTTSSIILLKISLTKVFANECISRSHMVILVFESNGFYSFVLTVSGVVFNEMKGVYSQPDNILGRASQQASLIFLYFCIELSHFFGSLAFFTCYRLQFSVVIL